MQRSLFTHLVTGYDSGTSGKRRTRGRTFVSTEISGSVAHQRRDGLLMRLLKYGERSEAAASQTSTQTVGAALMTFGLLTLLFYFIHEYFAFGEYADSFTLTVGVISALCGIPCLLFDKPIGMAMMENTVTSYVFFEFFCIKRPVPRADVKGVPVFGGVLCGAALFAMSYFISVWAVCVAVGVVIFVVLALLSPEFSFFVSILAMPYLSFVAYSDVIFSFIITVTAISLLRKVIYGKRALFFEQYDIYIFLMMLTVLASGVFVKGFESFGSSVFMLVMSLGYVISGNLIINRRIADLTLNSFVISSLPVAITSVVTLIMAFAEGGAAELIGVGISSTFPSTDSLSAFMLVAAVFALALVRQTNGLTRVAYFMIFLFDTVALVVSGELFSVMALVLGMGLVFAARSRWTTVISIIALLVLPYCLVLLPDRVFDSMAVYIPGFSSLSELIGLWQKSFEVFTDNLLIGIGIGAESFAEEMLQHGVSGHANASNIFIELGLEAGVFSLLFFVILLLIRLRHRTEYFGYMRKSSVSKQAPFITAALFVLLSSGTFGYIWEYLPSFYVFWCVFGIGSATLRIAKRENDDRVLYYEDTRTPDRSEIDVEID